MESPAIPGDNLSLCIIQNKEAKNVIKLPQNSRRIASHLNDKKKETNFTDQFKLFIHLFIKFYSIEIYKIWLLASSMILTFRRPFI